MLRDIKWEIRRRGIHAKRKVQNSVRSYRMKRAVKALGKLSDNPMRAVYQLHRDNGNTSENALTRAETELWILKTGIEARLLAAKAQQERDARRAAAANAA